MALDDEDGIRIPAMLRADARRWKFDCECWWEELASLFLRIRTAAGCQ